MEPTKRKDRREYFGDAQTRENRIQLQRHARRMKRAEETRSPYYQERDGSLGPRNPVQAVEPNPDEGRGPSFAYDDHVHDLSVANDLEWNQLTLQHAVPAGGDVQQGAKSNEYAKTLTVNARKHVTAQTFAAPAKLVKITQSSGIAAGSSGSGVEVDVSGNTNGSGFTIYNRGGAAAAENATVLAVQDHAGNWCFSRGGPVVYTAAAYYWASSIPTNGNTGIHASWEKMGSERRFAGVCVFESVWPTVGAALMSNVAAMLDCVSGSKGAWATWGYLGSVDITFAIDIVTGALDFSGGNPTYATILGLTGTEIGTCRVYGKADYMTVDSTESRAFQCIYAAKTAAWDTSKKLHGLRIRIKTETSTPLVGAVSFGGMCNSVQVISWAG